MTTTQLLKEIQYTLQYNASQKVLASHQKFVPGLVRAYGVPMPVLNDMAKTYKAGGFELAEALWKAGAIEERVLAAKLLGKFAQKDPAKTLELVEQFSAEIADWAVCDALGMQSVKPLVKNYTAKIFTLAKKLNTSTNHWQRRLSLVLVEYYTRDEQYHPAIQALIAPLENDPEYYVKKAVVWIKRNFEKGR